MIAGKHKPLCWDLRGITKEKYVRRKQLVDFLRNDVIESETKKVEKYLNGLTKKFIGKKLNKRNIQAIKKTTFDGLSSITGQLNP